VRRALVALALAASLAVAGSCVEPFTPSTQLNSVRVLAIRSTPPELSPDGSVTLDALVFVPGDGAAGEDWTWCPSLGAAATNYACALSAATLASELDPDGGIQLDAGLGSGSSVSFVYPVDPTTLEALCRPSGGDTDGGDDAGTGDAGSGDGGVDDGGTGRLVCGQTLDVSVLLDVDAGWVAVQAFRSLTVNFSAPSDSNTNPTIAALAFAVADGGPALSDSDPLQWGVRYQLVALLPASASDSYSFGGFGMGGPPDLDGGRSFTLYEGLSLAWYATGGTFGAANSTLVPTGLGQDGGDDGGSDGTDGRDWSSFETNTWTAASGSSPVRFIVVVRDTRGGVGWWSVTRAVSGASR